MKASSYLNANKVHRLLFHFIGTFCLAFIVIGLTKFMVDDGSWINYLIVVAGIFSVSLILRLANMLSGNFTKK